MNTPTTWKAASVVLALLAVASSSFAGCHALEEDFTNDNFDGENDRQAYWKSRSTLQARRKAASTSTSDLLNVLLIVVDDMRPESKSYNKTWDLTPEIDSWASQYAAQQFDYAYTQESLCGPSRASFLTARDPMSLAYHTNTDSSNEDAVLFSGENLLITDWFYDNDYYIAGVSKIFHYVATNNEAFDNVNADYESEPSRSPTTKPSCDNNLVCKVPSTSPISNTLVDVVSSKWAINKMSALKNKNTAGTPWFMAVGFHRPHLPFWVPSNHYEDVLELLGLSSSEYADVDLHTPNAPDNLYEIPGAEVPAEAYSVCPNLASYDDYNSPNSEPSDMVDYVSLGYFAAIHYVDAHIGKILDELVSEGMENDTVVAIVADHGWSLGEHGAWCKRSEYELTTRVPAWIRDPRATQTKAKTHSHRSFLSLVDLFPTLADLAGIPISMSEYEDYVITGVSRASDYFRNAISEETAEVIQRLGSAEGHSWGYPVESAFSVQPACFNSSGYKTVCDVVLTFDSMGLSVRTERYRYTEWWPWSDEAEAVDFADGLPEGRQELYDHDTDDFELTNLANLTDYADIVSTMSGYIRAKYLNCSTLAAGSTCNAEAHCMTVDNVCYSRSKCSAFDGNSTACDAADECKSYNNVCYDIARIASISTGTGSDITFSPTNAPSTGTPSSTPTTAPTPEPTSEPTEVGETASPTNEATPAPTSPGESAAPTFAPSVASTDDGQGGSSPSSAVRNNYIGGVSLIAAVLVAMAL